MIKPYSLKTAHELHSEKCGIYTFEYYKRHNVFYCQCGTKVIKGEHLVLERGKNFEGLELVEIYCAMCE